MHHVGAHHQELGHREAPLAAACEAALLHGPCRKPVCFADLVGCVLAGVHPRVFRRVFRPSMLLDADILLWVPAVGRGCHQGAKSLNELNICSQAVKLACRPLPVVPKLPTSSSDSMCPVACRQWCLTTSLGLHRLPSRITRRSGRPASRRRPPWRRCGRSNRLRPLEQGLVACDRELPAIGMQLASERRCRCSGLRGVSSNVGCRHVVMGRPA